MPVLTSIVNLSMSQGVMPSCTKEALLDPLLKQSSLDHELFCHYRPISNLMFTSKLCERVVAMQVNGHLNENGLQRLHDRFGIQGTVYRWFESYLEKRRQFVSIGKERSTSHPLTRGVLQGSVLGHLLFSLYTAPLGNIMRTHGVSLH